MSALIELQQISKTFGGIRALSDVTLSIAPGITGLLGPNGAGKSTLIKILLGLLRASSGTGKLLGFELGKHNRRIRASVGYMPEDDCFIAGLSGVESVQFMARLSRFPAREGLRRAHEILDFCGMGQERYRPVETYSTGMRQNLRFAQALVHDPSILILDEPTSGLDPQQREATLNRIRILASKHGKTVLLCTHILPDVQSVSQSVVILAGGRVQVADSLANLNRSRVSSLQVKLLGGIGEFGSAMRSQGFEVQEEDGNIAVIPGAPAALSPVVWRTASSCGAAIRSLVPSRTSLEEIFLSAVGGASHGDA